MFEKKHTVYLMFFKNQRTVKLTIVPNFSKWLLSLVMVLSSLGIFLTIRASEGLGGPRMPMVGNDGWGL